MGERSSQIVLLIRAFEEADREGMIISMQARRAATRRALRVTGLADWRGDFHDADNIRNGETISRRARLLFDSLVRKIPALRGVLRVARLGTVTTPMVIGLALLLGVASNALGPERRINLLSVPLLGTLAWNLLLYLWWSVSRVLRFSPGNRIDRVKAWGSGLAAHLSGLLLKAAIRRRLSAWKRSERDQAERLRITSRAILRFGALWQRCASDLLTARVQRLLHVGAAMFALGLLGGIYFRGLALAYSATWESTWLAAGQVQSLMNWILGPAAFVLGRAVPDVAPLQAPLHGGAAAWIHLFAATILLAVVLPRTGLALWQGLRCARLASELPLELEDGYCRRMFRDWRGGATLVEVVPYSYQPGSDRLELLKSGLRDHFGSRADLRMHGALEYGDGHSGWIEPAASAGPWKPAGEVGDEFHDHEATHCHVIVFNMAQPPEPEVHGVFLEELKERAGERGDQLLAVLDAESFDRHVRDDSRKDERVRAWQRITRQAGIEPLILEPAPGTESGPPAIASAIWPGETATESEPDS